MHRILAFKQEQWLKPWIDYCTARRMQATTEFESDLAKLMANATFGKSLENVRNRQNIRLIVDKNKLTKAVSRTSFRQSEIINDDLVLVKAARRQATLNKPISVGFVVLELSKLVMYDFFYCHLSRDTATDADCCLATLTRSVATYRQTTCTQTWPLTLTCTIPVISTKRPCAVLDGKSPRAW